MKSRNSMWAEGQYVGRGPCPLFDLFAQRALVTKIRNEPAVPVVHDKTLRNMRRAVAFLC